MKIEPPAGVLNKEETQRRIIQGINADRWLSHELGRLAAEGHQVIGDSVIMTVKKERT